MLLNVDTSCKLFWDSASCGNLGTRLLEYVNVYESFYISADISLHTAMFGHHGFPRMLIRLVYMGTFDCAVYMGRRLTTDKLIYCFKSSSRAAPYLPTCLQQSGRCPKILLLTQQQGAELEGIVCAVNRCSRFCLLSVGAV